MTDEKKKVGRPRSNPGTIFEVVVSMVIESSDWMPSFRKIEKEIEEVGPNGAARTGARRWTSKGLEEEVLAYIEENRLIHRTDGRALAHLARSLSKPVEHPVLMREIAAVAEAIFMEAYRGRLADASPPGSRHRLRWILLGHHISTNVRRVLASAIDDDLSQYVEAMEVIFEAQSLESVRPLDEVVSDIAAVLDGYLMRAVVQKRPAPRRWSRAFGRAVCALIEASVVSQNSSAID